MYIYSGRATAAASKSSSSVAGGGHDFTYVLQIFPVHICSDLISFIFISMIHIHQVDHDLHLRVLSTI